MLIKTKGKLWALFLKGSPEFSAQYSLYMFKGRRLVQKWINQLLSDDKNLTDSKKITKRVFREVREYFGEEPRMHCSLQIGHNIFCYYHRGKMKLIDLYFDGHATIRDREITKKHYANVPGRKKTFFWLFNEIDGDEKEKVKENFFESQLGV